MSVGSKTGGGSRASDDDGRTSVKVGALRAGTSLLISRDLGLTLCPL